jgi:hypothetical protein
MWTENDVRNVLINPVYTMVKKDDKPMISEEMWLGSQKKLLKELGEDEYFNNLLAVMKETFGEFVQGE